MPKPATTARDDDMIPLQTAADLLGVHRITVERWISRDGAPQVQAARRAARFIHKPTFIEWANRHRFLHHALANATSRLTGQAEPDPAIPHFNAVRQAVILLRRAENIATKLHDLAEKPYDGRRASFLTYGLMCRVTANQLLGLLEAVDKTVDKAVDLQKATTAPREPR